jgi:hypothetical protein
VQKSFAQNIDLKLKKNYHAEIIHAQLTIFIKSVAGQLRATFGFMVFSPFDSRT